MGRSNRLWAPAIAFAVVGIALLVAPYATLDLRGGLVTAGGYALAVQLVLAALLVTVLEGGLDAELASEPADDAGRTFDVGPALLGFYRWHPLPALGLGFGLSTSLTAMAIGALDDAFGPVRLLGMETETRPSELVVGVVLVATTLPLARHRGRGFLGWCGGLALGAVLTQIQLGWFTDVRFTWFGWAGFAVAVCGVTIALRGVLLLWRRRSAEVG